jgi:hypothetical protein
MQHLSRFFLILVCCAVLSQTSKAQTYSPFYSGKHEVGLDVSAMLGNFLSLRNSNATNTPYAVNYAFHTKKFTARLGANGSYVTGTDFVQVTQPSPGGITLLQRNLIDHSFGGRLCLELHKQVLNRVQLNYGLDFIAQNIRSEAKISGQYFKSKNTLWTGGGPALRLSYKISDHIHLMTETVIYARYGLVEERLQDNVPVPEVKNYSLLSGQFQAPINLYLNFNL